MTDKILFCKISYMSWYKGIDNGDRYKKDIPYSKNAYTMKTGHAGEEYNFKIQSLHGNKACFGFVETKSTNGIYPNQIHIENIIGSKDLKGENMADDVLVVWFAPIESEKNAISVVGWYKNAVVFREYQYFDNIEYAVNILAWAEDCVLLPDGKRRRGEWKIPKTFNFGEAHVRYPKSEDKDYISRLINNINNYDGDNWICKYPDKTKGE